MNTDSTHAFITGVYGQDGSYLAEYLLGLGYTVLGLVHKSDVSHPNSNLLKGKENFSVCVGDICDIQSYASALSAFHPEEVYNIAAVSDLKTAVEKPEYTCSVNFIAFESLVRHTISFNPAVRIFQALSSRILLPDENGVITEDSILSEPKNAYDEAKRDSYEKVVLKYRREGFYIASGFLCNHESPRREGRFVTGKIAAGVARISKGVEEKISVGNINAKRDWSFAGDVVRAMHATLQSDIPRDYVIGSAELHTVKEFIEIAFEEVGVQIRWTGEGVETKGYDQYEILRIDIDSEIYQPDDNPVVSRTELLERLTDWKRGVTFPQLVSMMVKSKLREIV
jgi:GDPmannose 4,6-dehydratase